MSEIHGKTLIAVAGEDIFGKALITTVNKEIMPLGFMAIGINIKSEDFNFFISNLADSKVEITIFMPEFQKRAGEYFGKSAVLAAFKKDGGLVFIEGEKAIDDRALLELIEKIRRVYGD